MSNDFQKFFKETLSTASIIEKASKGIKFVMGFPKKGEGSEVQSVLFDKENWTLADAKAWLKDHDFKGVDVDDTENTLRFRQADPGKYARFRTITPGAEKQRDFMDSQDETTTDTTEKMDGNDTYEGGKGGNVDSSEQPHKFLKPNEKPESTKKSIVDLSKIEMFEKSGGAPFQIFIEKATVGESKDGRMIVEGLATTTNVDHDQERMSPEAIKAMEEEINKNGVPLISEHSKEWDGRLGKVFKAWVDERNQLHVQAELDKDMSKSIDLYKALKKGAQLGLSIAGIVKKAGLEMVEGVGKKCKTFYDVLLKEVSVTNRPSNFDTWLIAKGIVSEKAPGLFEKYANTDSYQEYLQANPKLDWQYAIAKSVQDDVLNQTTLNMEDEKKEETVAEVKPAEAVVEEAKAEVATEEVKVETAAVEEVKVEEVKTEEVKTEVVPEVVEEVKADEAAIEAEVNEQVEKAKKAIFKSAVDELVKSRIGALEAKARAIAMKHVDAAFKAMGGDETETETTVDAEKAMESTTEDTTTEVSEKAKKAVAESSTEDTSTEKEMDSETTTETETSSKAKKTKKAKPEVKEIDTAVEDSDTTETEDEESETTSKSIEAIVAGVTANLEKKQMRFMGNLTELVTKMMKEPLPRKGIAVALEKKFVGNTVETAEEVKAPEVEKSDKQESFQDFFKKNLASQKE